MDREEFNRKWQNKKVKIIGNSYKGCIGYAHALGGKETIFVRLEDGQWIATQIECCQLIDTGPLPLPG